MAPSLPKGNSTTWLDTATEHTSAIRSGCLKANPEQANTKQANKDCRSKNDKTVTLQAIKMYISTMKILLFPFVLFLAFASGAYGQTSGALQLHPQNPHYFLYRQKPLLIVGSGEHYGAVINLDFDYKKYLQTIADDSLNTTRVFTGAYVEKPGDFGIGKNTLAPAEGRLLLPWQRSTTPGYFLGGNKFDLTKWDETYFIRLKDFLSEAQRHDIIVEITLFSSHYASGWKYSPFNPENNINQTAPVAAGLVNTLQNGNILAHQERYVRKIVREINGFDNVYFEIQNEPWADQTDTVLVHNEFGPADDWRTTIQVVSALSNSWQRTVSQWIKDEEKTLPKKHLISQNISNYYYPVTDADPNVSIFNFHYAMPAAVKENYYLNRVIGFNETGFAGRSDITYRRQAWRFLMAGGGLFNHLDYSFSTGSEDGSDTSYKAPGGGSPSLRKEFAVLRKLFGRLQFIELHPDHSVVVASPGAFAQALSNSRTGWIIYYEPMSTTQQPLLLNLPAGTYRAEWIDVHTGAIIHSETITKGRLRAPKGGTDKVVVIKKR
jgi:hypothetical protein